MDLNIFKDFSEEEKAYATSLLDPFHDSPYRLTGAPSDQLSSSTVFTVNQEIVVGAGDFGLPVTAGNKWDLHVSALPLLRASNSYCARHLEANRFQGSATGSESEFQMLYPISASANATGGTTFTDASALLGITNDLPYFNSSSSSIWQDVRTMRVIGQSFEVVDETPQLYKQGSVTVYSRASCQTPSRLFQFEGRIQNSGSMASYSLICDSFNAPPNRIQQATIIPNSKTWMAEKGAYVVAKPATTAPPFFRPGISNFLGQNPTDSIDPASYNCWLAREGIASWTQPQYGAFANDINAVLPFNTSGAYFTGLNSEFGVFRIRSKINYEIIPDPSDTSLISLATPTLPRNPRFEAILGDLLSRLPAGNQQVDNDSGDVWRAIKRTSASLSKFSKVFDPVITPLLANTDPALLAAYKAGQAGLAALGTMKTKKKKNKSNEKSKGTTLGGPGSLPKRRK